MGLSTSGNSPNVIAALRLARERRAVTVGFTGADGGALLTIADHCFTVPSKVTARIQEAHIAIAHIWCEIVDSKLFG